jgi:PDZ domain-containing protein
LTGQATIAHSVSAEAGNDSACGEGGEIPVAFLPELCQTGVSRRLILMVEGQSMRWCAIIVAVFSQVFSGSFAQEPVDAESPQILAEIANDLKALSAPEFQIREAAGQRLIARKLDAVNPLIQLAQTGTGEASVRAFDLLRQLYRDGDDAMVEAVETAFEMLQKSENPIVASRAEARIEAGAPIRHRRAIEAFERLGGVISYRKLDSFEHREDDESTRLIESAMIDKNWTGGDAGLKYLRRIEDFRIQSQVRGAGLFVIKGCKVSPEAVKELEAALPSLMVQHRGPSCLGVSPYTSFGNDGGLTIGTVKEESAAEIAGLRPGDVLLKFNGKAVDSFDYLVEKISETQPGDKVPVVYQRNGVQETVIVELLPWVVKKKREL